MFAYCQVDATASENPLSLASVKSRLVLAFLYRLTQVVLEKRALNGCSSSNSCRFYTRTVFRRSVHTKSAALSYMSHVVRGCFIPLLESCAMAYLAAE